MKRKSNRRKKGPSTQESFFRAILSVSNREQALRGYGRRFGVKVGEAYFLNEHNRVVLNKLLAQIDRGRVFDYMKGAYHEL